ncbi:MAG: hypothetical protein JWQ32_1704 [Marmoricola sp.]|nr:hypothetical protein [Marmoricola sp.]
MYGPDDNIDFSSIPWQLLIRARYAYEVDAVIASIVARQVTAFAPTNVAHAVTAAARESVSGANREHATPEAKVTALSAVADYDDNWCGTPYPHHPHFSELGDPLSEVVIAQSLELVQRAGSEELQKTLGSALADHAAALV